MRRCQSILLFLSLWMFVIVINAMSQELQNSSDSIQKTRNLLEEARVRSADRGIEILIRNVDISRYPEVKIIVEAYNTFGFPLDTLHAEDLTGLENGVEKKVLSTKRISVNERVPVDFVFAIDK